MRPNYTTVEERLLIIAPMHNAYWPQRGRPQRPNCLEHPPPIILKCLLPYSWWTHITKHEYTCSETDKLVHVMTGAWEGTAKCQPQTAKCQCIYLLDISVALLASFQRRVKQGTAERQTNSAAQLYHLNTYTRAALQVLPVRPSVCPSVWPSVTHWLYNSKTDYKFGTEPSVRPPGALSPIMKTI